MIGAEEETRTPTGLRPPDPEPGASTTSATSAQANIPINTDFCQAVKIIIDPAKCYWYSIFWSGLFYLKRTSAAMIS